MKMRCARVLRGLLVLGVAWVEMVTAPGARGSGVITNCTQADLEAALAGGGDVSFACSGTITLTNTMTVGQDTTLDANGQTVVISGGNAVRIFQVDSNVSFLVRGLTLTSGRFLPTYPTNAVPPTALGQAVYGGGLLNLGGTVILDGCTITNCLAEGGRGFGADGGNGYGAGLCSFGGRLQLTNCALVGNTASGGLPSEYPFAAGDGFGGAVYADGGRVDLVSVRLENNRALGGQDDPAGQGCGGAVFVTNAVLSITDSLLAGNLSQGGNELSGHLNDGVGGGVYLAGGSGAISRSVFLTNSAVGGSGERYFGGYGRGGAVYSTGALQVRESSFEGNSVKGGGGGGRFWGLPNAPGQGGGVYSEGSLVLNGCTFNANRAAGGHANYYALAPGPGEGGALYTRGNLAATNCTLVTNQVVGGTWSDNISGLSPGYGGALFVEDGTAWLVNLTVALNRADGSAGKPGVPGNGGGICCTNGQAILVNCIVANSTLGKEVFGTVVDGGYNLCSDATANFTATGSLNNTDPMLLGLANNGGPTATMGLKPGSPAREAIPSGFPAADQRGVSRPAGPAADIGAFEADYTPPAVPPQLSIQQSGSSVTIGFTAEARTYRLLSSSNLATWSVEATNTLATAGVGQFVVPIAPGKARLFRVVTP